MEGGGIEGIEGRDGGEGRWGWTGKGEETGRSEDERNRYLSLGTYFPHIQYKP